MGTSRPAIKSLRDYLVPAEELQFAEYVFRVKAFNPLPAGTKRKDHKDKWFSVSDREDLWTIVNALANTCGGVIEILTVSGDPVKDLDLDHLQTILSTQSKDVYKEYLTVCNKTGRSLLVVRKANVFITACSHLFTRGMAETLEVTSHEEISTIVNRPKGERNNTSCLDEQNLVANGECTLAEVKEIEFKQINCTSAAQLVERIKDKRFERVLFAMPNLPRGGDVIIGVDEDEVTKKYIFRGVELDEDEKQLILIELSSFMRVSRFWGQLNHTDIKEGVHWFCYFIPLSIPDHSCDGPPCSVCPQRGEKYLIHLKFPHFPGGVFLRAPEAFVLNEDGSIEQMQFNDWFRKHGITKPMQIGLSDCQPEIASLALTAPVESDSPVPETSDQKRKRKICDDNVTVKFSTHSSYKKPDVSDRLQLPEVQHPEKFDLFKMSIPINYTPPRNEIESLLQDKSILQTIEKLMSNTESFGIAADSLFSLIRHTASAGKPQHHIMDVMAVNQLAHIILFVICSTFGTLEDQKEQRAYTMTLGRILKMQITNEFNCGHVVVQCRILALDGSVFLNQTCQLEWFTTECDISKVCGALVKVFTNIQNHFSECILKDAELELSTEQLHILHSVSRNRFNFIEGPPGCGKTLLAQSVCKKHGKNKSVYITKSKQVLNFVSHTGLINAKWEQDLLKTIQNLPHEVEHIVIDDAQNLSSPVETHKQILDFCQRNSKTLYVFQDSRYQNFKDKYAQTSFPEIYFKHQKECQYDGALCDTLKVIRRNSGIVGSYITALVSDVTPKSLVQCASRAPGDDIIVQQIKDLRAQDNNGLVTHVQGILSKHSIDTNSKHYTIQDVAILIDHTNEEALKKEVKFFKHIFHTTWPESCVQSADKFPVEGVVVDSLDNFSGLEKRVVIFVIPGAARHTRGQGDANDLEIERYIRGHANNLLRQAHVRSNDYGSAYAQEHADDPVTQAFIQDYALRRSRIGDAFWYHNQSDKRNQPGGTTTVRSILNPKYKIAIATRGIDRVDFVQEENLEVDNLRQLKLDRISPQLLKSRVAELKWTLNCTPPVSSLTLMKQPGHIILCHGNNETSCVTSESSKADLPLAMTNLPKYLRAHKIRCISVNKRGNIVVAGKNAQEFAYVFRYPTQPSFYDDIMIEANALRKYSDALHVEWVSDEVVIVAVQDKDRKLFLLLWDVVHQKEVRQVNIACDQIGDMSADTTYGMFYVCDNKNNIQVYTIQGGFIRKFVLISPDQDHSLSNPISLSAVSEGRVLVCHQDTHKENTTWSVTLWRHDGTFIKDILTNLPHEAKIIIDETREVLYLLEKGPQNMKLMKYDVCDMIN